MFTKEIITKLMTDDSEVFSCLDSIVSYYNLKHTLRYNHTRTGSEQTESVAEHIYALHILCDFFIPLHEEIFNEQDKIRKMLTWHDIAEAFVGDMTSNTKTEEHKKAEADAEALIVANAPTHMHIKMKDILEEYNKLETRAALFAKALDRLEPLFHLLFLSRKKDFIPFNLGWSSERYKEYRFPYVSKFPLLLRFDQVISKEIDSLTYFPENRI